MWSDKRATYSTAQSNFSVTSNALTRTWIFSSMLRSCSTLGITSGIFVDADESDEERKWECFDSDGNRPMRTERLLALQPAIGRFPRLRVVLEFKRRPFFLPVWFPGGVPVESLGKRCFSSANTFLYLRNLVRGKEVTLVPIMANVNPQTEGLIGGRIQNPEVWDFEELAGVRWWQCADLQIIRPGLDQTDIARAVQVVIKSSQGEWEDLVMHYLRIEMGIDWMITRNGPNFNHDRLIKAALLFLRHRAVHYVDGAYRSFRDTLEGEIRRCWADWHSTAEDTSEFGESVLEDYIKRLWDGEPHENELLYEHIRETEG